MNYLKINGLYNAHKVSHEVKEMLGSHYLVSNWTEEYGAYFHAIRMEKTMMFFTILMILIIAVFNLISTLVMVVTDKRADIGVLRTLGASARKIMAIFICQESARLARFGLRL